VILEKAVIPAAGRGSRMLPVTKCVPKELLPVAGKPMIQFCVEEAVRSGIKKVCIVISRRKELIRNHFSGSVTGKVRENSKVKELIKLVSSVRLCFIYQPEPSGLAEAIYRTKDFVNNEPFALLLPDNIFFSSQPALAQLLPIFEKYRRDVVGLIRVSEKSAPLFGNSGRIGCKRIKKGLFKIIKFYDKKSGVFPVQKSGQELKSFSRCILTPRIFKYIEYVRKNVTGELDDVPVFQEMLKKNEMLGYLLRGRGFDTGNPAGYQAANQFRRNRRELENEEI